MSISLKNDAGTFSTNLNQSNPTENVNIALPTTSGTMAKVEDKLVLGTAYTFTGTETFKDFTGIPSWAKRITVMFNGVSTSGTSLLIVQIGDGTIQSTGYVGSSTVADASIGYSAYSSGFIVCDALVSTQNCRGAMEILSFSTTAYVEKHAISMNSADATSIGAGSKTLSATIDRIRITTVNGTDLFDAGSINIMWE